MKTKLLLLFALMYGVTGFSQMEFSNLTSSEVNSTTATLNVNLSFVCSGSNYRMQYNTSAAFFAGTVDIGYQTNNINGIKNHPITGLLPNTQYFFRFYASPNQGCGNTTQITSATASFITLGGPAIAEYNFNNAFTDVNGNNPFISTSGTSFVTGRDGVTASGAININSSGTTAIIPNLSYGAAPRTVSMWVKMNVVTPSFNFLYHYGTDGAGNGTFINLSNVIHFPLSPTNHSVAAANAINTWYHYVISYDGTNSKIYRNSVLLNSAPRTLNTGANTVANLFRLGLSEEGTEGFFNGTIDDLKIYNYALSQTSVTNLFTSNSTTASPSIASVSATEINTTSATISYSLNANNTATTSAVKYGLTNGNLISTAVGFAASGNTTTSGTASLTGLLPGTQYFYRVEATNAGGTTQGALLNFTTSVLPASIAEYNFNGVPTNINGTTPFGNVSSNDFVQDRNGIAGQALNLANGGIAGVSIVGLPIGNAARSVSIWVKPTIIGTDNILFVYGAQNSNNSYGFSFTASTINNFAWGANDLTGPASLPVGVWKHIVCTYSSTGIATVYIDGVSTLSASRPTWNTTTSNFNLRGINSAIDDLKIYNYALSQIEVTSLFTNNTLSSPNFNQNNLEVALYPNPANDVLNIETTSNLKLIEIYNIQGQKVLSSTQKVISVSNLPSGMYMIKIQDAENAVAIKKFMKQ